MLRNACCALALFVSTTALAADRPNLVVVLSDDCGYNEFSMHGSKTPTPRIDALAAGGVRFTNGYVSGSVCSPTRAGLLTGRYQQRFGHEFNIPPVYSESNGLPLSETLLPAVLAPAGYRTIALGKWHLGYAPKFHPMERGFTDYYGFLQGARSYWPLAKPTKLNQVLRDREPVYPEPAEYMTDQLAQEAVKYIEQNKDKPFFMYLAFNATHGPNQATEEDLAQMNGNKIAAMTIALDRAVGTVLDGLETNGLTKNTLVVFTNDNGGAQGHDNLPLHGQKGSCWEGGYRVPLAIRYPGVIPDGRVLDEPVISLDIFPTLLAAAGIDNSPGKPLDGVNLLPYASGETETAPHKVLYWKNGDKWAIREGNLKLCVPESGNRKPMLFDLLSDVREKKDLASERPDDVARLRKLYDEWKATHESTPWGPGGRRGRG